MTRFVAASSLIVLATVAAPLVAQTYSNPAARSTYAPKPAAGQGQAASGPQRTYGPQLPQEQSAPARPQQQTQQQAQQPRGPQIFGRQPVRQVSGQQPVRQPDGQGAAPAQPPVPQQPGWFPLEAAHETWVNEILQYWEKSSSKVKTFECNFTRWDYDPAFVPAAHAKTISSGVIKYAQPDKGLYRVEELLSYGPPTEEGGEPQYFKQDRTMGEHWVCDGKQIFAFDAVNKTLHVNPLPPQMQGRAIVDGPLPFMFGARAETIKARYWIRGIEGGQPGEYHLEAVPKSRQDAQNFKMIQIVLDEKTFLPKWLLLFAPNYTEKMPVKSTLKLDPIPQDKAKWAELIAKGLDPLKIFHKEFYEPTLPKGWKRVVEGGGPLAAAPANLDREANRQNVQPRPLTLPK